MRLPVPHPDGDIPFELKLPDSVAMLKAGEKASRRANFQAMLHLLKNSIVHEGPPDYVNRLPLCSAEYLLFNVMKEYGAETKLSGVYPCPVLGCEGVIHLRQTKDYDNRIDLDERDIAFFDGTYEECVFYMEIDDPKRQIVHRRSDKSEVARFNSWSFRQPLLEDFISLEEDRQLKDQTDRAMKMYLVCLKDFGCIDFDETYYNAGNDEEIKRKMRNVLKYDLVRFPRMEDMNRATDGIRQYGIHMLVEFVCPDCRESMPERLQFTDFFVSALRSLSYKM